MKERIIDTALIAGLVLIALIIAFTLFGPLPSRTLDARAEPSVPETASSQPAQPTTQAAATPDDPARDDAARDDAEPTGAPALNEVPADALELGRIGFSFAGPVGACNVPLEPWRHVAVSRDLLAQYPCGSEVTVYLSEQVAGRMGLRATIGDTMGPDATRTLNIYVAPEEPAGSYGVQTGWLGP